MTIGSIVKGAVRKAPRYALKRGALPKPQNVVPKAVSSKVVAYSNPTQMPLTPGPPITPQDAPKAHLFAGNGVGDVASQVKGRIQQDTSTLTGKNRETELKRNALSAKMSEIGGSGSYATDLLKQSIAKREALKAQQGFSGYTTTETGQPGDISGVSIQGLSDEQNQIARTIYMTGKQRGASDRDIQIALMTAFQESGMRNINYGDRDSVGVFQQRTSQGWGSVAQIMDPTYSTNKFFDSLLKLNGRDKMALTQAAQAVQRSAFPNAYAKHEGKAANIMQAFNSVGQSQIRAPQQQVNSQGQEQTSGVAKAPTGVRQQLLNTAFGMLGIPYAWGGGGIGNRSSRGIGLGTTNVVGVDCSGLTSYVYGTLGIKLPRKSDAQYASGVRTSIANAKPGDLVGWGKGGHVAIYIGNGQILHSPRPGQKVQIRNIFKGENVFAVSLSLPGD